MTRRLLIAGTAVAAIYCVYVLVPVGSAGAWVMAALCVGFPIAAWIEAGRLRARGSSEAADVLVIWAFSTALAFSFMTDFAVDARGGVSANDETPAQR
ncbi:MAG TPA: hypothetical protein VM869_17245 [Enhygromyxa sp.]|nr:hypothetical protein [Enhygromyxa sp.]